jgi:hypothetical protein
MQRVFTSFSILHYVIQVPTVLLLFLVQAASGDDANEVDRWQTLQRQRDDYPLTWEAKASQAQYDGMNRIAPMYAKEKICTPHTWHAAEAFLYLLDSPK